MIVQHYINDTFDLKEYILSYIKIINASYNV